MCVFLCMGGWMEDGVTREFKNLTYFSPVLYTLTLLKSAKIPYFPYESNLQMQFSQSEKIIFIILNFLFKDI